MLVVMLHLNGSWISQEMSITDVINVVVSEVFHWAFIWSSLAMSIEIVFICSSDLDNVLSSLLSKAFSWLSYKVSWTLIIDIVMVLEFHGALSGTNSIILDTVISKVLLDCLVFFLLLFFGKFLLLFLPYVWLFLLGIGLSKSVWISPQRIMFGRVDCVDVAWNIDSSKFAGAVMSIAVTGCVEFIIISGLSNCLMLVVMLHLNGSWISQEMFTTDIINMVISEIFHWAFIWSSLAMSIEIVFIRSLGKAVELVMMLSNSHVLILHLKSSWISQEVSSTDVVNVVSGNICRWKCGSISSISCTIIVNNIIIHILILMNVSVVSAITVGELIRVLSISKLNERLWVLSMFLVLHSVIEVLINNVIIWVIIVLDLVIISIVSIGNTITGSDVSFVVLGLVFLQSALVDWNSGI